MKRSEAVKKLMQEIISPYEIISYDSWVSGVYEAKAERLLQFIEKELGMIPPGYLTIKYEDPEPDSTLSGKIETTVLEWEPEDE